LISEDVSGFDLGREKENNRRKTPGVAESSVVSMFNTGI
jgi:hypothetical protein